MHDLEIILNRVEQTLDKTIDYNELCSDLAISATTLQRFFPILFDITLTEYIRKRRLTLAAYELKQTKESILSLALKYGYETADSFTVAFKKLHGATPTSVRKGASIKIFKAIELHLSVEGGETLPIEIKTVPSFYVAGHAIHTTVNNTEISKLWNRLNQSSYNQELFQISEKNSFAVCKELDQLNHIYYLAGWEVSHPDKVKHLPVDVIKIPEMTFAIVPCIGKVPTSIYNTWRFVWEQFLPESHYSYSGEIDLEYYTDGNMESEDYQMEIWVPIKKVK